MKSRHLSIIQISQVASATVPQSTPWRTSECSSADFCIELAMRVNYLGTVHIAKATVPQMVQRGHGSIIVTASIAGWIPLTDVGAYSASKSAVIAFCEVLAAECKGSGIRVTCVCPAAVETPMLQGLRFTHPEVVNTNQESLPPRCCSPRPP